MSRLRTGELMFLVDLQSLDRIHLGMLAPSAATEDRMKLDSITVDRLVARGLVRLDPSIIGAPEWGGAYYLTTKGLRALQRRGLA